MSTPTLQQEVAKRKTFAIISHPDAGKTTLTEKFLLYGGALQLAGAVKARKKQTHAVSDWMTMEKERGISITSTVLSFDYKDFRLNLLDTPGHQDFSEDTYRTLLAADCVIMILDGARGIQEQTLKLFEVCRAKELPIFTFINKMDRPSLDPFEILDEIEDTLQLETIPFNWPLGSGSEFRGVYDLSEEKVHLFSREDHGASKAQVNRVDKEDENLKQSTDPLIYQDFIEGLELLEAGHTFNVDHFLEGIQTPVFFGSALSNFGLELFLDHFVKMAPPPKARPLYDTEKEEVLEQTIPPTDEQFSGFVFKIQANMDPKHRDRIAFVRIVSGTFERGSRLVCQRTQKAMRMSYAQQLFAQERVTVEKAYAGDVIGTINSGDLILGDTLSVKGKIAYEPVPTFPPEHFAKLLLKDPSRRKHFLKAMDQLCLEGAIQVFFQKDSITRDPIIGAVGQLQFEVVQARLKDDYRVDVDYQKMNISVSRWIDNGKEDVDLLTLTRNTLLAEDLWLNPVALFPSDWDLSYASEKNPQTKWLTTGQIG